MGWCVVRIVFGKIFDQFTHSHTHKKTIKLAKLVKSSKYVKIRSIGIEKKNKLQIWFWISLNDNLVLNHNNFIGKKQHKPSGNGCMGRDITTISFSEKSRKTSTYFTINYYWSILKNNACVCVCVWCIARLKNHPLDTHHL